MFKINIYIVETEFAAKNLINLINSEQEKLKSLIQMYNELQKQHEVLYEDFISKDLDRDENFTEAQMMNAFYVQARFQQSILSPILKTIAESEKSINAKQESIKALSGALLQIAKQGISIVLGGLNACPDGRLINTESIKNIIWQGRNQSIHYEEGTFRTPVVECFNAIGIPLTDDNLAKAIIELLGWHSYKNYEDDMLLLLG